MSKRMSVLLVLLTVVSGLIGGVISGRIFAPKVAIAEEAKQSKVLTVEGLNIVDDNGKLLMKLGTINEAKKYRYGLFLYDQKGSENAAIEQNSFMVTEDVPALRLRGGTVLTYPCLTIQDRNHSLYATAGSGIFLHNTEKLVARIGYSNNGNGEIEVSNKNETGRATMNIGEYGGCFIAFGNPGQGGAMISIDDSGGGFTAFGKKTVLSKGGMAFLGINTYGNGHIILSDKDGYPLK